MIIVSLVIEKRGCGRVITNKSDGGKGGLWLERARLFTVGTGKIVLGKLFYPFIPVPEFPDL